MKSHHTQSKAKVGGRGVIGSQQAAFELKHRVVLSLNKLADRDTYQIGVEELERTVEGLGPEGIAPFLSCVIETDSEQKSAVRKECVRIMGMLARFHGALLAPYLGKMVAGIIKRLKDPDSVVRDACVETVGFLASNIVSCDRDESVGSFVVLAKPIFEALSEQNRYVQAGSALCLARVIDNACDPPISILPQMLTRVIKLLKNQHFMAKPALIELVRSIIQVGGASTEHSLSAAVTSLLEALKCNDWTTRKAASVALAGITVSAGSLLRPFKTSCIRSLECCRFDKVKPVRDAVMQALECWKTLSGSDSPEPSEAGSSTKENFRGADYPDVTRASSSKDTSFRKSSHLSTLSTNSANPTKKRAPLSVRKTCPNYVQNNQYTNMNDWQVEISLPKARTTPDGTHEESEGSCITKTFERTGNATLGQGIQYEYNLMDDKPECSSMSDLVSESFETKHVTVTSEFLDEGDSANHMTKNFGSVAEDINPESHICSQRMKEHNSLDSTVTDSSPRDMNGCCLHTRNELALIRKQLLNIESRQSNLMNLLQVFMGSSMDNLSILQSNVHNLEYAVEKIVQKLDDDRNILSTASHKILKRNQSVSSSPRLSSCTPRPSVDTYYRQPSQLSMKSREQWDKTASKSRSSTSVKEDAEIRRDPTLNITRNTMGKDIQKISRRGLQSLRKSEAKITEEFSASICTVSANDKQNNSESKSCFLKHIKDRVCEGDIESAYMEALCSGDDLVLINLMDRTGPILEILSHVTACELLSTVAAHVLDQRYLDSITPWLQQVVDLSTAREPIHLHMSKKARREFLIAIQEAATLDFLDPEDKQYIAQLAMKLRDIWFEAPFSNCRPVVTGKLSRLVSSVVLPQEIGQE